MPDPKKQSESLTSAAQDVGRLVVGYARQEIVDPIKGVGRFLAFGMLGAVLLSTGLVLLLLGALRVLQTETGDAFDDGLSWLPYVFTLIGCVLAIGVAMKARSRGQKDRGGR